MFLRKRGSLIAVLPALLVLMLVSCSSPTPTPAPTSLPTVEPTSVPTPVPPTSIPATEAPTLDPTIPSAPPATIAPTPVPTPVPTATIAPAPTATPTPEVNHFEGVTGIIDPTNFGWPREVEGLNGVVSIPAKPLRIINASVGHDEVTLALVPVERLVGVGISSQDATFSNISSLVQDLPVITRDPETIIALSPDVVVTSPWFAPEGIDALSRLGIPTVQTNLDQDLEARIENILLIGYIYGEEERAVEFATEIRDRYQSVVSITGPAGPKPRVLSLTKYTDAIWTTGAGSTGDGIIVAAGGINAASDAGIVDNQPTSLEGIIAMAPDVIIIPQPEAYGAGEFRQSLLDDELLAELPAIKNGRVHLVDSRHFTTLSYWNLLGAEALAHLLWPDLIPEPITTPFSLP